MHVVQLVACTRTAPMPAGHNHQGNHTFHTLLNIQYLFMHCSIMVCPELKVPLDAASHKDTDTPPPPSLSFLCCHQSDLYSACILFNPTCLVRFQSRGEQHQRTSIRQPHPGRLQQQQQQSRPEDVVGLTHSSKHTWCCEQKPWALWKDHNLKEEDYSLKCVNKKDIIIPLELYMYTLECSSINKIICSIIQMTSKMLKKKIQCKYRRYKSQTFVTLCACAGTHALMWRAVEGTQTSTLVLIWKEEIDPFSTESLCMRLNLLSVSPSAHWEPVGGKAVWLSSYTHTHPCVCVCACVRALFSLLGISLMMLSYQPWLSLGLLGGY